MEETKQPEHYYTNSIFWVDVDKIRPNPFQPRKEFDEARLKDMADSIRMYGVLQPLVVTRQEFTKDDGGLMVVYELIAGERRLRAAKLAGVAQVPVVIRASESSDKEKLEMAIIENLQREDLNPMDRAKAFQQLNQQFGLTQVEIGRKMGKSREYVANSIRLLALSPEMQSALSAGKISEGHTRPLLMLIDRPEEQNTLFREIMLKKMTVREAERIARKIAFERARKFEATPEIMELEERLTERLGTRVSIEQKQNGGKVVIDYFSVNDLHHLLELVSNAARAELQAATGYTELEPPVAPAEMPPPQAVSELTTEAALPELANTEHAELEPPMDDSSKDEQDLYAVSNFSL
ncbi:MAG: hypothetical protein A2542_00270 [Parcubacteria group bacterium RIFOXYD2_FULL_52_8]|nr:MAG: hypothetical protein A2542_00270 [Parcubacteria group bacterium RIFOXYD2_FULL_52_8]